MALLVETHHWRGSSPASLPFTLGFCSHLKMHARLPVRSLHLGCATVPLPGLPHGGGSSPSGTVSQNKLLLQATFDREALS